MKLQANFQYLPSFIFLVVFLFSFLFYLTSEFSRMQQFTSLISLVLISTIGIYHGAFDIKKGIKISNRFNITISKFSLLYILFSLVIVLLWFTIPKFLLSMFLLISIHHFGSEDYQYFNSKYSHLASLLRGILIIILPLIFHFNETIIIFRELNLFTKDNFFLGFDSNYLLLISLIIINFLLSINYVPRVWNKILINIDMVLMILLNYFFDPLFAFSIYFCFLHSVRNIYKTKEFRLNSTSINLISFITFILLIIVFSYLYSRIDLLQSLNYTIFIGLAALTFPHIATDIIYNQLNTERK